MKRKLGLFCQSGSRGMLVVPKDGEITSAELEAQLAEIPDLKITSNPTFRSPDRHKKSRIVDPDGSVYTQKQSTSICDVYVADSPEKKTNSEVQFKGKPSLDELWSTSPYVFDNLNKELFSFTLTPNGLRERIGVKRTKTQRQIMGTTAKALFEAWGAIIPTDTAMHLAHRHGHSLGGPQSRENLDPGTAGSNYTTLIWIEAPFKDYMLNNNIEQIEFKGTVYFDPRNPEIPLEISYEACWGNGRTSTTSIYPQNKRKPTYSENQLVNKLIPLIHTPYKSKFQKLKKSSQDEEYLDESNNLSDESFGSSNS